MPAGSCHAQTSSSTGDRQSSDDSLGGKRLPHVTVLVVEDNPGDARLANRYLRSITGMQCRVTTVGRLSEALSALAGVRPDAVLLDLGLPDSTGTSGVTAIRSMTPEAALIVLTGGDEQSLGVASIQAGADDFLRKSDLSADLMTRSLRYAMARRTSTRDLLAAVADALVLLDDTGVIRLANQAAEDLLGIPEASLIGTLPVFGPPHDDTREVEITTDGRQLCIEVHARALSWCNQPATLCTLRDVTSERRVEKLRAELARASQLAGLGELAAVVAHDVNNVLTFLMSNNESLLSNLRADGHPSAELAEHNLEGIKRAAAITSDLQRFARPASEAYQLVDLNQIVDEAIRMTRSEIAHCASVTARLGAIPRISGDPVKLSQMLVNLLVNAAHAIEDTARHDGHVEIATSHAEQEVVIRVRDDGCGLPPDLAERIFEPFFTTKSSERGTGLGLAVVADVVRRHAGTIEMRSKPGETEFAIRFPCTYTVAAVEPARPVLEATALPTLTGRVLVIDDDPLVRRVISRLLQEDHTVITASSGSNALALIRAGERFDAILCDMMMPDMDGYQLFEALQQQAPEVCSTVIFVSGGAFTPATRRFISQATAPVVSKPFTGETLRAAIATVMRRSRPSAG